MIIIFVEEFQPLTKMWERNRILHLYNIAMTLLAHIINVESWPRCCSGWCKICGIMLILMGVVGKIVSWMLSFGHDVDFDEGGGWKNCKEYHICPWGREVPLLALCTPWLLATYSCAYLPKTTATRHEREVASSAHLTVRSQCRGQFETRPFKPWR